MISFRSPLLLDGPMGTELERRGVDTALPIWSARALLDAPELVERIHCEYIEAGADIVTVNSFRTGRRAVEGSGLGVDDARQLTATAVALARSARRRFGDRDLLVAGSEAPVEDSYAPEDVPGEEALEMEHQEHIEWLMESGCDLVLIETMNTLREALAAGRAAHSLGAPCMISVVTDSSGERLLSGEPLSAAVERLGQFDPLAILVNCASPRAFVRSIEILAEAKASGGLAWEFGGYPNGGEPDPILGYHRVEPVGIDDFVAAVAGALERGARLIGSCCGTTPAYTAALHAARQRFVSTGEWREYRWNA